MRGVELCGGDFRKPADVATFDLVNDSSWLR